MEITDITTTKTYKSSTSDEDIPGIRKDTRHGLLSLLIISDSHNIFVSVTYGGILFWPSQVGLHFGIRRGEWNFFTMGYRSNRQSEGRSRNLAFMGGLINDDLIWARLDNHTLMPITGTLLTLIAEAEIEVESRRSSWAIWSMAVIMWLWDVLD